MLQDKIYCWNCSFRAENKPKLIHISRSYLRVNQLGQLVFVCKKCSEELVDPRVIRNFKRLFASREDE